MAEAERSRRAGLIEAAMLVLQGRTRVIGSLVLSGPAAHAMGGG
jgi:hypothetical protein